MPAYPRPIPKEKGKTKDTKEKRRSAPQWKNHEREDARWLQDTYGEDTDPYIRHVKSSTGRVGHITGLGYDSTSNHAIGESKDHKLPKWLLDLWASAQGGPQSSETRLPKWIRDAWAQVHQAAAHRGSKRRPVLFLSYGKDQNPTFTLDGKQVKLPEMHVIDREHHTELIKGWLAAIAIRDILQGDAPDALRQIQQIIKDAAL